VQPVLRARQLGAADLGGKNTAFRVGQIQQVGDGRDRLVLGVVLGVFAIDVDPQELAIAEFLDLDFREVDGTVVPVGIEQPGGDATQLTRASRAAAITAMTATRYWRTSMARSEAGSASSIANGCWVLSVSIDLGSSGSVNGVSDR
jgi:hypothetical protein